MDSRDTSKLCIHTITTKPWSLAEAIPAYASAGVKGVSVWRDVFGEQKPADAGQFIRGHGLEIVSLVRGGFFPHPDAAGRQAAIDENKRALDEAAQLEAPLLVLVCGAVPGQPLEVSRVQIREGIEAILSHAQTRGVRLAIEPLHPMYADSRSAICTLAQANTMAEVIDSPWLGVAIDVYHLWWDPDLEQEIRRCGDHDNLLAFHICDWKIPTTDMLQDRGLMGEGCIDIPRIRSWIEAARFDGFHEVEIFSTQYWRGDQQAFLNKIKHAYLNYS